MRIKTFGAIYIGTYEVSLKVFELPQGKRIRVLDYVRSRIELGQQVYETGDIDAGLVDDLCKILKEFGRVMEGYKVEQFGAYAGAGLRDAGNALFVLDQIKIRTGIPVQVLSNSEHRFLTYKSLAVQDLFQQMIEESTALIDIGGGSLQVTLYLKGKVVTTQHIDLGLIRLRGKLSGIESMVLDYDSQIKEMVNREIDIFRNLYLVEEKVKYVIIIGDYVGEIIRNASRRKEDDAIEAERFLKLLNKFEKKNNQAMAEEQGLGNDPLMASSVVLYRRLVEDLGAELIWSPGVNISDGIGCEYALKNKIMKTAHDFDEDVRSAARSLAIRYQSFNDHSEHLVKITQTIYDAMKKAHGMGKREGLLLQVSTLLHDCGRYISMVKHADIGYEIIMASEIIGITHQEREMVASVVKYNAVGSFVPYEDMRSKLDREGYLTVIKLSAILRMANALDRSHRQKIREIKAALKEKQLIITVEANDSILLEKDLFQEYAGIFEQIFGIEPILKEKRVLV